jgi:LysM repeat protein
LCAYINAYEECEYDICTDAYSPDYEINTDIKTLSYQCLSDRMCDKISVSDYIDVSKNGITCVYDTSVTFKHTKQIACDGKIISDGFAFVDVLYLSGEGKLCTAKKTIPYSFSRDINSNCEYLNVKSNIEVENISYNVSSSGEIEIKISMNICVDICNDKEIQIITSIDVDKTKYIDKTNLAGITIYFVQKGDSLWEIAKKYHTTTEKIAKVNNIDESNIIVPGQRLLIPKK